MCELRHEVCAFRSPRARTVVDCVVLDVHVHASTTPDLPGWAGRPLL